MSMQISASNSNEILSVALERYSNTVRRICYMYLKNSTDVDDVFQEIFLKYIQNKVPFQSDEHEKAWIIRVTINKCKDICKSFWRQKVFSIDDMEIPITDEIQVQNELLQIVLTLPPKYKDVIYLFYYEGYTVPQMSKLLLQKENTIYSNLHRARALLKEKLGGNNDEYTF